MTLSVVMMIGQDCSQAVQSSWFKKTKLFPVDFYRPLPAIQKISFLILFSSAHSLSSATVNHNDISCLFCFLLFYFQINFLQT